MKKNIKEDTERKVIKQEYLDENTLLEHIEEENDILITVRFIEKGSIKEHFIAKIEKNDYEQEIDNLIKKNEDSSAIAVFSKVDDEYTLKNLYLIEEHSSEVGDFLDVAYQLFFEKPKLNKRLTYKKEG